MKKVSAPSKNPWPSSHTSWQPSEEWYKELTGLKGHYYHEHVILPHLTRLMKINNHSSVLDLACGQGILGRALDQNIRYHGIDAAPSFIEYAQTHDTSLNHHYVLGDVTLEIPQEIAIKEKDFTHCILMLALQNIDQPIAVFKNAAQYLQTSGRFFLVMNHPCFRIPKYSDWDYDQRNQTQCRKISRYMTSQKTPITIHPSQADQSETLLSFHYSLSYISECLFQTGFLIEKIEEWISDKESEGKKASLENLSRKEIPLFMAIIARKQALGPLSGKSSGRLN